MIPLLWLMTAAVWGGHVGLLFADDSALYQLLTGQGPAWLLAVCLLALVPQLILIPWAWHHVGKSAVSVRSRRLWRIAFFFTGFLATTVYLLRSRSAEPTTL